MSELWSYLKIPSRIIIGVQTDLFLLTDFIVFFDDVIPELFEGIKCPLVKCFQCR